MTGACNSSMTCTDAGASDVVRVDLRAIAFSKLAAPFQAELCLEGTCRPRQPDVGGQAFFAGGEDFLEARTTAAEVRVYSAGRTIRTAAGQLMPKEFAPNGVECGPVVSQAAIKFDPDGDRLVSIALDAS
jgi:hypothetical protein